MADEVIDFYWSFRSHYCYLSIARVVTLAETYPVRVNFRPVYPIAIRTPEFFQSIPRTGPNRWQYIVNDAERIAERLGIPFGWPDPDPVVMDMTTFEIADTQPYIYRLTRLGVHAARQDLGLAFASIVSGMIFGGERDWDRGDRMARALSDVNLDLSAMDRDIQQQPDDYDEEAFANERALGEAGHWGVPTLVIRGEPFFGQDRIEDFRWRLEQYGIRPC